MMEIITQTETWKINISKYQTHQNYIITTIELLTLIFFINTVRPTSSSFTYEIWGITTTDYKTCQNN